MSILKLGLPKGSLENATIELFEKAGWLIKPAAIEQELQIENPAVFRAWFWLLRWVAPISIALILYSVL